MQVKEALFSILVEFDVLRDDAIALDTFSGCGSVGIEALSRGVCVSACMCVCSAEVSSFALRSQELALFVKMFNGSNDVLCVLPSVYLSFLFSNMRTFQSPERERLTMGFLLMQNARTTTTRNAGVGQAVFVDYSKEACRTIEENLQTCDFDSRSLVVSVFSRGSLAPALPSLSSSRI